MPHFSKTQEVVDAALWEEQRLIDEKSQTTAVAAQMTSRVAASLLKGQDPDYDMSRFEFLVFNDNHPNAFFLSREHTKNGKDVIAVSAGLINECRSEDELAAILGHELGHFTKKETLQGSKNTVFEEQSADMWAVNLLYDAGYNPVAMADICGRLFLRGEKTDLLRSLLSAADVHGSGEVRVENINTAITALKQQKGEFKPQQHQDWKKFQDGFNRVWQQEGYDSYLDTVFKQQVGHKNYQKMPLDKTIQILCAEVKAGQVNNRARWLDMLAIVQKSSRGNMVNRVKDYFYINAFSKRDKIESLAAAYTDYVLAATGASDLQKLSEMKEGKEKLKEIKETLRSLSDNLGINPKDGWAMKFKPFGEFADTDKRLQDFIKASSYEEAARAAAAVRDNVVLYATENLADEIGFSNFDMSALSEEDKAVGRYLPYGRHQKWISKNKDIQDVMTYGFNLQKGIHIGVNSLNKVKLPFSAFTDDKGKIIAVGEEARRLEDEEEDHSKDAARQERVEKASRKFYRRLALLNDFAAYKRREINSEELFDKLRDFAKEWEKAQPSFSRQSFDLIRFLEGEYYASAENSLGERQLADLKDSPAYRELLAGDAFVEKMMAEYSGNSCIADAEKNWLTSLSINRTFMDNFMPELTRLQKELISQNYSPQLFGHFYTPQIVRYCFSAVNNLDNSENNKYQKEAAAQDKANAAGYEGHLENLRTEVLENVNAAQMIGCINNNNYDLLSRIHNNVLRGREFPWQKTILNKLGCDEIKDGGQLLTLLEKLNQLGSEYLNVTKLGHELTHWYLKQENLPAPDLLQMSRLLGATDSVYSNDYPPHCSYQHTLGSYIEKHRLFPTGDIHADIQIYEQMSSRKLFSSYLSNREKFLENIIGRFNELPPTERESTAFKLLTQQYLTQEGYHPDRSLPYAPEKYKLMDIWVGAVAERLGTDDGSPEYLNKIKEVVALCDIELSRENFFGNKVNQRSALAQTDKNKLLRRLSDKVVSKKELSAFLGAQTMTTVSAAQAEAADVYGRSVQVMLTALSSSPELCDKTIKFLNTKLTPESVTRYRDDISGKFRDSPDNPITTENIEVMHKTFWSEDLEVRAVVMNKLLNRYAPDLEKQAEYVCDMYFEKDNPYRKDAELIFKTTVNSFEPFERGLILSAMASANENRDERHQNAASSVGQGMSMFFENMGPAFVKFGQLMSYIPDLPSEIREHLGKLKDKADIPPRWEIYKSVNETLPEELSAKVKDVGRILGAGSFWTTVEVQWQDEPNGKIEPRVLSLLRPYAVEKFAAGDKTILSGVKELGRADSKYQQLYKVAEQAGISGRLETDVVYGFRQLCKAREIYGGLEVIVNDTAMKPDVADWLYYGVGGNGGAYKLMEKAAGSALTSDKHSLEDKKNIAMAYTALELTNLLRGDVWDIDRHSGQQNFETVTDHGMKKFIAGIFDTGAQMRRKPGAKDKAMLGELLYGMVRAARTGKDMNQYMFNKIKKMDSLNKLKIDTGYIAEVQRGLIALSDIMEYQKEIKDKDGNVIQERRMLDGKDMQQIADAVLESNLMDKTVKRTLTAKVILNKFRPLRQGWASSLWEGLKKAEVNPVGISYAPQFTPSRGRRFDKPASEISRLQKQELEGKILGVDKQRISPKEKIAPTFAKETRMRA